MFLLFLDRRINSLLLFVFIKLFSLFFPLFNCLSYLSSSRCYSSHPLFSFSICLCLLYSFYYRVFLFVLSSVYLFYLLSVLPLSFLSSSFLIFSMVMFNKRII